MSYSLWELAADTSRKAEFIDREPTLQIARHVATEYAKEHACEVEIESEGVLIEVVGCY